MFTITRWSQFVAFALAAVAGLLIWLVGSPPSVADTTFVVDTVTDDGALSACTGAAADCSLRGAVTAANTTAGTDTIEFDIPAGSCLGGVCRIVLTDGPLTITETAIVDGTTQPQNGSQQANVCATDTANSYMRIEIVTAPTGMLFQRAIVLNHGGAGSTVRGFAFGTDGGSELFPGAITLDTGSGHHVACNHFGLDGAGTSHLGADDIWVGVNFTFAEGSIVGTNGDGIDDIAERNVFSDMSYAVYVNGNDNNRIAGNYMAWTADGDTPTSGAAVLVRQNSSNNLIGSNRDGVSDELERNYLGDGGILLQAGDFVQADNRVVGNTFGVGPTGIPGDIGVGVRVAQLGGTDTGFEISHNTFVAASSTAVRITGESSDAAALVSDNTFGVTATGDELPNATAIQLDGAGSSVVQDNSILHSDRTGIWFLDDATLGAGSADNCIVGNGLGFPGFGSGVENGSTLPTVVEDSWWGSSDGPSGVGSGSGDIVIGDVDFTPWRTSPAEQCNEAPVLPDASFTVAENVPVGATVGSVTATDDGEELEYSITGGDPTGDFAIDPASGTITTAKTLNFDTTPSYTLTVAVNDPFESDTATVTVTVTDVGSPVPTFDDVPLGHTFFDNIEWLASEGITKGCNPPDNTLFCPDDSVTRGQMAAFLHRALGDTLVPGAPLGFTDIALSVFAADIEWLGSVGVTKGCNPPVNDLYCPTDVVTRGQMAAFLVRAFGYTAGAGSDRFSDDDGSVFEADIERLAEAGVTLGCNPPTNDNFCPDSPVTRGQMAAFLNRAMVP